MAWMDAGVVVDVDVDVQVDGGGRRNGLGREADATRIVRGRDLAESHNTYKQRAAPRERPQTPRIADGPSRLATSAGPLEVPAWCHNSPTEY